VLVTMFGFGLVMTATPLYATRIVGLSARQVGLGMTIAGLIGLLAAVPVGDLTDRRYGTGPQCAALAQPRARGYGRLASSVAGSCHA
jgi:MFS family permease